MLRDFEFIGLAQEPSCVSRCRTMNLAVIMPARDEEDHIEASILSVPSEVQAIIVIDDASVDDTASVASNALDQCRDACEHIALVDGGGRGVGAAILSGVKKLSSLVGNPEDWAFIVMAGDGQMDPRDLPSLVTGLENSDHVKGNRFRHSSGLKNMPIVRRWASRLLSVLTSLATGWRWGDPQCGYTATRLSIMDEVPELGNWTGYGYPNWWALNLAQNSISVSEVPVRSVYSNETSGIRIRSFLPRVSLMLLCGLWTRGWSWYVLGRGSRNVPFLTRMVLVTTWFGAIGSILFSPVEPALLISTIPLFSIARFVDFHEQKSRTSLRDSSRGSNLRASESRHGG